MHLQEARTMAPSQSGFYGRAGTSPQAREVRAAARCDVPVLITGRREAVEALLFNGGHVVDSRVMLRPRADRRRNGGTVLLQDVGKLSIDFQAMLADRLSEIRGLGKHEGSTRRLIASTAEALWPRVETGTFDDRLFYRLNVMHLVV